MSIRRLNPFASNASVNTHRDSAQSNRPPTYTSNTTDVPTYTSHELNPTSAHDRNERVSAWSASLPSASSVASPDSEIMFDQAESSLTDTFSAVSIGGQSAKVTRPTGPRYSEPECYLCRISLDYQILLVYYRVYAEDGAVPSANPVYSDDRYLGRITATLVAPPHTVISLKSCLSTVENIDDSVSTSLFIAASSRSPMDDAGRVSILAYPGPGCTPNEPMALVATISGAGKIPEPDPLPVLEHPTPVEKRYCKCSHRLFKFAHRTN
jgi:hypothetical protein